MYSFLCFLSLDDFLNKMKWNEILPILPIKNPWVSINFQKFAEKMWKNNVKSLILHGSIFMGENQRVDKSFPFYKQPDENYNQCIDLH